MSDACANAIEAAQELQKAAGEIQAAAQSIEGAEDIANLALSQIFDIAGLTAALFQLCT